MDGSGIIDELDSAFSSPGRCLPVIHGDKPHPRSFHPFPAVPQTGPQDGQVETEFAVVLLHVLVVPVLRDAVPPVFVHDVHKTAEDAVICLHIHFFFVVEPREAFVGIEPPFIRRRNVLENNRHEGIRLLLDRGVTSCQGTFEEEFIAPDSARP